MKLLTLNTHSLSEKNESEKLQTIANFILKNDIDVIALQEVNQTMDKKAVAAPTTYVGSDTLKEDNLDLLLSHLLGNTYQWNWIGVKVGYDRFDEGVAIFTKHRILESENTRLTHTDDYSYWKKRNALGVHIDNGKQDFWVYTAHLGWWNDDEEPFIDQWHVLNKQAQKSSLVYLAGDFNAPDELKDQSYDKVRADGWYDTRDLSAFVRGRYSAEGKIDGWEKSMQMRIDYIFTNRAEKVKTHKVVFDGHEEDVVSDHYGIYMEDEQ